MAHVMLPRAFGDGLSPFKFADTAVPALLRAFEEAGAHLDTLAVRLVGGAAMLAPESPLNVGARNLRAVREQLQALRVPVRAEAVGGNVSRTVSLYVGTGRVAVRTAGGEEQEL
jgi:chemotaxis protein CheD